MGIKVLFIGEIVGKSGVFCVKKLLSEVKKEYSIDFVIGACEGATGGFGIGKTHSIYLRKLGVEALTSGEKIFFKKDIVEHLPKAPWHLRPINYPYGCPGRGWRVYTTEGGIKIAVINILGNSGFQRTHLNNPFLILPDLIAKAKEETPVVIVDFHASTTAEKKTMFYMMDGKVSAIVGTHTKALSADNKVLSGGTAVICDSGRTGSLDSVGGLEPEIEIKKYMTQLPERSKECWENLELQGVVIDIDPATGKALSIERLRKSCAFEQGDNTDV